MLKKKKLVALVVGALLIIPSTALAASKTYSGVLLPALTGNANLPWHSKATKTDYFTHQVTSMGGSYKTVNVAMHWIEGRSEYYSPKALHRVGNAAANANLQRSVAAGSDVKLVIENGVYTTVKVSATGNYNLR